MVSFLHHWALINFIEAASFLGREQDVVKYSNMAEKVRRACEANLWDGEWYLRGFTRKGIKIGSKENEEGRIFLESNSLAVLSEAASPEHGRQCMDSVDKYLYSQYGIHLVWPSFSKPDDDIGYITRVYKGIKENGSIFSHPNPWAIVSECKLGRGERAMKFYNSTLPYNQNDMIEIRQSEPYSYCQFIMGRDHTAYGRARHPWLTGSAGWAYHAATHWILGIQAWLRASCDRSLHSSGLEGVRDHARVARSHIPYHGQEPSRCSERCPRNALEWETSQRMAAPADVRFY